MKKLLLLCVVFVTFTSLAAIKTGKSIFYADSYMLRAKGVEAAYWNPANINMGKFEELWVPGINTGIYISNNALDLDTYNYVMSQDKLDNADKQLILSKMDGSLRASMSGNTSLIGYAVKNLSFSSSITYMGRMELSEQYVDLLLYGNTDDEYVFDKGTNDLAGLSFVDITYGMGGFTIPFIPDTIPPIRFGFSASALAGIGSAQLQDYNGYIRSSIDTGISLYQDATVRTALGGAGFKSMIGLATNPTPNIQLGLTLDNIFGNITWAMSNKDYKYHFQADNVYAANIDTDFYTQTKEVVDTESYSTELPPELRLGAFWTPKRWANFSTDYVQGFKNSLVTSNVGRLSVATRLAPISWLPVSFGLNFGNARNPWSASYGISFRSETGELGVAVQSFDSLIPGPQSKGVSVGSFLRLWF